MIKTKICRTQREWIAQVWSGLDLLAEAHCATFSAALAFCCAERARLEGRS